MKPLVLRRRLSAAAALATVAAATPASGQLPTSTAAHLGTANNYTALARGFGAIALNPAGLAMPGTPGFSIAVVPARGFAGLDPVGLSDIADFEGQRLTTAVKESWLQSIATAGGETGSVGADVSLVSLNIGAFGFQVSSVAHVDVNLNDEAAELVLFGNAGRTGEPRDFVLSGSSLDGFAATTVAASFALPADLEFGYPGSHFAAGVTLKYTVGHGLLLARDMGGSVDADPLRIDLQFPTIAPGDEWDPFENGSGVGLDIGLAWEGGPWAFAAAVQNVFNTFEWDLDGFSYRSASALFEDDEFSSSFDERPVSDAPASLRAEALDKRFEPVLAAGGSDWVTPTLTATADLRHQLGDGLRIGGRTHAGVGLELALARILTVRGGIASVSEGFQIGGGAGLRFGPVNLNGAVLALQGDTGDAFTGMFVLSFGGR